MFPPSLAIVALGTWQFAIALLLRPAVDRWLARPRAGAAVVAANGMALTVFLWQLTALVIVAAATLPTGLMPQPAPGSAAWWAWRPVWFLLLAAAVVPLVAAFARVELRRVVPPAPVGWAGRGGRPAGGRRAVVPGQDRVREPRHAVRAARGRRRAAGAGVGAATNAIAVVLVVVVHNLLTNLWAKDRWYVPANLATAGVLVALGGGVPVAGRPLDGIAAGSMILAAGGLLAVAPATRPLLSDRRMEGVDARGTAWRALVRIPLGTVVLEEVAFRGVLPTLLSPLASCALFGLWHVLPAGRTLETNGLPRSAAALLGAVAVTGLVGGVLWELRQATGGLLAPALVHAAANSGATVAAYWILRAP